VRPTNNALGGVFELKRDLHVDLVAGDVAVLDHDVLVLDPATLYTPQGLSGSGYTLGEVFRNPEHVRVWEAARRGPAGGEVDWEGFLVGYEVAVDWPACSFYEELMEAFPEAPVILTVRDSAPWYESMRSTIYELRRLTTGPLPVRAAFA